jgi:hypothetical protein
MHEGLTDFDGVRRAEVANVNQLTFTAILTIQFQKGLIC